MMEVWKEIPKYKGRYLASNLGRIKTDKTICKDKNGKTYSIKEKIKKFFLNKNGYLTVSMCIDNVVKTEYVHYLVLSAFTNDRKDKMTVNHINEIKTDNRIENLEWLTYRENNMHGTKVKRTSDKKFKKRIKIDKKTLETIKIYNSKEELLKDGYKLLNTKMCCINVNKTAHGFIWKYLEV